MRNRGGRAAAAAAWMSRLIAAAVVAVAGTGGCGGPATGAGGGEVAVAESPKSALVTSDLARFLPRTTSMVVAASNPQRMAEDVGWLGIVEAFEELREARESAREEIGIDLFAPSGWSQIGIDPTRPAAFALLDSQLEHGVFAAGLSSPDAFVAWFEQLATKQKVEYEEKALGGARMLHADEVVFVMRDQWLFLVVGQSKSGVELYAETIATAVPEASLQALPAYEAALEQLAFGSSLATWWDLGTIMKNDTDDIAVADEFGAAAMGLELTRTAVETRTVLGLESTGELRQMWRDHGGVPAVVRTAPRSPLFLLSLALDIQSTLDLAAEQAGADPAQAKKSVRDATGIDLDRDFFPLITGEMGFRVGVDQGKLNQGNPAGAFNGAVLLGLFDGIAAKPRLDKLLATPAFNLTKSEDGRYFKAPPLPGVEVFIGVAGNALVATTDVKTFDLVADAGSSFADEVGNAGLSRVLSSEDAALVMTLDLAQASALATGYLTLQDDELEVPDDLPSVGPPKYSELLKEAESLRTEISSQQAELADLRARVRDLGGRWGSLATTAHVDEFGVRFDGGAYLAANEQLDVLIADTLRYLKRLEELDRAYDGNRSRHRNLLREAREILARDDQGESAN